MLYNLNKEIFKSEVSGMKVYMEMERDNASMIKKAGFMVYVPNVGLSNRFTISRRKLIGKAPADMFLDMGFKLDEVNAIADEIHKNIDSMNVVETGESVSIEMVHKLLTKEALADGYMMGINGVQYCAVPTDAFRGMVKKLDMGYRSYKDILQTFRMMDILKCNAGRLDYHSKASESRVYCFVAAEGVTETSDLWAEGAESTLTTTEDTDNNEVDTQEVGYAA